MWERKSMGLVCKAGELAVPWLMHWQCLALGRAAASHHSHEQQRFCLSRVKKGKISRQLIDIKMFGPIVKMGTYCLISLVVPKQRPRLVSGCGLWWDSTPLRWVMVADIWGGREVQLADKDVLGMEFVILQWLMEYHGDENPRSRQKFLLTQDLFSLPCKESSIRAPWWLLRWVSLSLLCTPLHLTGMLQLFPG